MPICVECRYHSFKTYYHDPYYLDIIFNEPEDFYTKTKTFGVSCFTGESWKRPYWKKKQDHFCSFVNEYINPITGEKTSYTNLLCQRCNGNGQCTNFEKLDE